MYSAHAFQLPSVAFARNLFPLESSKTDERGHAVHEECYLFKLGLIEEITAQTQASPRSEKHENGRGNMLGLGQPSGQQQLQNGATTARSRP
jgi:hypothetical protein